MRNFPRIVIFPVFSTHHGEYASANRVRWFAAPNALANVTSRVLLQLFAGAITTITDSAWPCSPSPMRGIDTPGKNYRSSDGRTANNWPLLKVDIFAELALRKESLVSPPNFLPSTLFNAKGDTALFYATGRREWNRSEKSSGIRDKHPIFHRRFRISTWVLRRSCKMQLEMSHALLARHIFRVYNNWT